MQDNIRVENWCGHDVRFIERNGDWWAIFKDVCDALGLKTWHISQRLDPDMLERVEVETERISVRPKRYKKIHDPCSKGIVKTETTNWILAVNEIGIYEALFMRRPASWLRGERKRKENLRYAFKGGSKNQ